MAYKALYRKYRPETFDNMVGQKHIITTLKNAIKNNKIAHAYIFSGPRGTGKTTTAKLLAKALNCSSNGERPCNECEQCRSINEGTHPDIIEIDAASNNGIEDIREIVEKVKYAPLEGKYKVYIIDEVHMMTASAFNALLKTLEEPPEHVVFILATTDIHKVLPTVLSRCQRFDFAKISFQDIKNRIVEILNLENITFEEKVPDIIAELAEGGMRDALSILDQVVAYAGNNIKLENVYEIYGLMSNSDMIKTLEMLSDGNTKEAVEKIEDFIEKGVDIKRVTRDLMVCLKDMVVYNFSEYEPILEKLSIDQVKELSKCYDKDQALEAIEILDEAMLNYRNSTNYRLYLELAILKISKIKEEKEEIKVVERVVETIAPAKVQKPVIEEQATVKQAPVIEKSEIITYSTNEYVNILNQGDKNIKQDLQNKWQDIRNYLDNPQYKIAAQMLIDGNVGAANKNYVLIYYEYKLLAQRAMQKNSLLLIRDFIKAVFGYDLEVFVLERVDYVEVVNEYKKLYQAKKLPSIKEIPHLIPLEKKEEEIDTKAMEDLFGDNLTIDEEGE